MELRLKTNETLQSGDDIGDDIRCYECNTRFIEGTRDGNVACPKCGQRHAYVVEVE